MDIKECIRFANENPVAWVATTYGDQPRVRPLQMWFADATGFYFQTWTIKDICREIKMNPESSSASGNPEMVAGPCPVLPVRLSGWTIRL